MKYIIKDNEIEQLFYDLYNNCLNKKANDKIFETLYKEYYNIARIHYIILMDFLYNESEINCKLANNIQEFIKTEIFKV